MDSTKEIRYETKSSEAQKTKFPLQKQSLLYGAISGFLMGLVVALINLGTGNEVHTGLSLTKYLVLGIVLGIALNRYKHLVPAGQTFKGGIRHGALITFYAAIMLIVMNSVINLADVPALITERFLLAADNVPNLMTINGVLFFECLVMGMIWTFIWLQIYKDPKPAK